MSVHITVSGKLSKQSQINDPEGYKKLIEHETRKLRIKQVRAQSKEFARKIRTQVSEEKERQLRNLEEIKAQELNLWRKNIVAKKATEYRHALRQVGNAHLAAQKEKESTKEKRTITKVLRSPRTRHSNDKSDKKNEKVKEGRCRRVQYRIEESKDGGRTLGGKKQQKLTICLDDNDEECSCSNDTDSDEYLSTGGIIESINLLDETSTISSLDNDNGQKDSKFTQTPSTSKEASLSRIPPVLLDVHGKTPLQPEVINAPEHVKDKHVETNRQFDSIVSKGTKKDTVVTETAETRSNNSKTSYTNKPENIEEVNPIPQRYTLISEIIAKQRTTEPSQETIDLNVVSSTDKTTNKVTPVTSLTAHGGVSPKVSTSLPTTKFIQQQRRSITPYPTRYSQTARMSINSGTTATTSKNSEDKTLGANGSTVRFYDYTNKFAKQYNQPPKAVAVPEPNKAEPNAMEQAALEKERLCGREKSLAKQRQKSEERGKVALEREQVRRDFVDLNEKLDTLQQKGQPILPTNANLHSKAYFADKAARKEAKMNSAIEELLSRPAIITCPDRRQTALKTTQRIFTENPSQYFVSDLNLGSRLCSGDSDNIASKSTDTDDSGTILLGYIDDQRDQIRNELSQCEDAPSKNTEKKDKLTQLLQRIETLRGSLLNELNQKPEEKCEPIGDCSSSKTKSKSKAQKQTLQECEQELKDREIALQKELAEVIQTQMKLKADQCRAEEAWTKAVKITAGKHQVIQQASMEKPLEIVIKVKGDKSNKIKGKSTKKKDNFTREKTTTPFLHPVCSNEDTTTNLRSSYDSNSTAYRSMPPVLSSATEQFVECVKQASKKKKQSTTTETNPSTSGGTMEIKGIDIHKQQKGDINPLIAQYVQRLLGMSRDSVKALEVSSSDIETPSSSVVNITANIASSSGRENSILSEDRLQRVERFVNENRNFICELEESIRTHSNASLETSLHRFEEIWKEKFKRVIIKNAASKQAKPGSILKGPKTHSQWEKIKKSAPSQDTIAKPSESTAQIAEKPQRKEKSDKNEKAQQKKVQVKDVRMTKSSRRIVESAPNAEGDAYATQTQLNHYAELTKNCSNRIAELTALITKVRQEKQRILEVTLTSVSDNERHSTEYAELPEAQKRAEHKSDSSDIDESQRNIPELSSPLKNTESTAEPDSSTVPLEKHKHTGRSRDSGISMPSRPVTALGQDTELEPPSYASSAPTSSTQRKARPPPPTIHRFSPQLPEDEVVHELSTIDEADTPATSRLNTSIQPETQQATTSRAKGRPTAFPTFEEYVKELNIDLTIFDPEQSLRMEHEYNDLIEAMKGGQGNKAYNYDEFPTLTTYLKNISGNDEACQSPETIEDLFGCLRLTPIIAKPFPSHQEYMERLPKNKTDKLIDSASLENLTELHSTTTSDTDSDTINIEYELKQRKILKKSFGSSGTKFDFLSTSGAAKHTSKSEGSSKTTTFEAGMEKLTSTNTDSASEKFQQELLALGLKWPKSMRSKEKQAAAFTSSSSDELALNEMNVASKSPRKSKKKKNISECLSDSDSNDRPVNLRDFLTRQLLKHAASSSESSLSGDSLRSQFFMAVLDSMTPSGSPRTNTNTGSQSRNGQNGLERQKTSTPVPTTAADSRTINENSKSNETAQSQLFSGESNISFVQHPERNRGARKESDNERKRQEREGEGQ